MGKQNENYARFLKNLGKALGEVRKESGYTQEEFGQITNRRQSAIGKMERGPVPNLPLRVIYEVANAIPMALSTLIKQAEQKSESESAMRKQPKSKERWPIVYQKIEALPPKRKEQIAKVIENVLDC